MNGRGVRNAIAIILIVIGVMALVQTTTGSDNEKNEDYEHTLKLVERLREIRIDSEDHALEVNFTRTSGPEYVRIEGEAKPGLIQRIESAKVENGVLDLRFTEKRRVSFFNLNISFNLNFSERNKKQVITVALTDESMKSLEKLKISSDSGSISVDGAEARESVITAASGGIRLGELQGGTLTAKADSGSIKLDRFEGSSLSLRAASGSIQAGTIRAELKAVANSGSITIDSLTGYSELKSDSGSIRIVKEDDTGADVSAHSGSVQITVPASYSGSYDLRSDSGTIHSPDPIGTSGERIKVRTSSGSIRIHQ